MRPASERKLSAPMFFFKSSAYTSASIVAMSSTSAWASASCASASANSASAWARLSASSAAPVFPLRQTVGIFGLAAFELSEALIELRLALGKLRRSGIKRGLTAREALVGRSLLGSKLLLAAASCSGTPAVSVSI